MTAPTPSQPDIDAIFTKPAGDRAFYLKSELVPKIQSLLLQAQIDELNHLGFDKRYADPILYVTENGTLYLDERLAELRAAQQTLLEGRDAI